jgi:hypothetical protein
MWCCKREFPPGQKVSLPMDRVVPPAMAPLTPVRPEHESPVGGFTELCFSNEEPQMKKIITGVALAALFAGTGDG